MQEKSGKLRGGGEIDKHGDGTKIMIAIFVEVYHNHSRARQALNGRRLPSGIRRVSFPSGKEGCEMVTHEELYLLLSFIVALITLLFAVFKYFDRKKK